MRNNKSLPNILRNQKFYFSFYVYKMYLTSAKGCKNAGADLLRVKNCQNLSNHGKGTRWFEC